MACHNLRDLAYRSKPADGGSVGVVEWSGAGECARSSAKSASGVAPLCPAKPVRADKASNHLPQRDGRKHDASHLTDRKRTIEWRQMQAILRATAIPVSRPRNRTSSPSVRKVRAGRARTGSRTARTRCSDMGMAPCLPPCCGGVPHAATTRLRRLPCSPPKLPSAAGPPSLLLRFAVRSGEVSLPLAGAVFPVVPHPPGRKLRLTDGQTLARLLSRQRKSARQPWLPLHVGCRAAAVPILC